MAWQQHVFFTKVLLLLVFLTCPDLVHLGKINDLITNAILSEADTHVPHDYQYIINHPELCNSRDTLRVLIVVHSAPNHFEPRLAIRQTWGSVAGRNDVRMVFALGKTSLGANMTAIKQEDDLYADILQEDFQDTYHNLTLKTVMMVKWANTFCPNAQYLLKIDDDCFLNPSNLLELLEEQQRQDSQEVAIIGRVFKNSTPFRGNDSKWYMSYREYPHFVYPNFVVGPSYVLTREAIPRLYQVALKTKHVHLEDVFLNGLCAIKANVTLIHDDRFTMSTKPIDFCMARNTAIAYHDLSIGKMHLLWWVVHDTRGGDCDRVNVESLPTKTIRYFKDILNVD